MSPSPAAIASLPRKTCLMSTTPVAVSLLTGCRLQRPASTAETELFAACKAAHGPLP